MRKKPFPIWAIALIIAGLAGAMIAVNTIQERTNSKNVQQFDQHDHDRDGTPDHGPDVKD